VSLNQNLEHTKQSFSPSKEEIIKETEQSSEKRRNSGQ
jgi:hypothetical protein